MLTRPLLARLKPLTTPEKIQDFITAMPPNFEPNGDTVLSVQSALEQNVCHCIEGAMIAAYAFMLLGERPLLMDLQAHKDTDHVVTLYKRNGCWGCISKTNHIWLRGRDPVYKSLRELTMSYFHEFGDGVRKTLRNYSAPLDLGRLKPEQWVTNADNCWDVVDALNSLRHYDLMTPAQLKNVSLRDPFEQHSHRHEEFHRRVRPVKKTA